MPDPKKPPANGEIIASWLGARLHGGAADWILGALLATFMAFVVDVLQWRSYDGISFRHNHGWLALFGLWLLCYWAVRAARRLWAAR